MKKVTSYKLQSSALQFAVFISILIALLLGSLVLYVYTFIHLKEQSKAAIENINLADSAINYLLAKPEIVTDTTAVSELERENQTAVTSSVQWGIFEKAFARTRHRKKVFVKTALVGSEINSQNAPTLFLQETYSALSLVGNTRITGNVFLSEQGVKTGYIAGNSYYGAQLIYGSTKKSGVELPKISREIYQGLFDYVKKYRAPTGLDLTSKPKDFNSFLTPTKGVFSTRKITLADCNLVGNFIIQSDTLIVVKKSARLKDILLIAPTIIIEDNSAGNFQAIASKSIRVGKMCQLTYPSALVLAQDNKDTPIPGYDELDNRITIGSESAIKGIVCYLQTSIANDFKTQVLLEKKAVVKGEIYCDGNFELDGTVSGRVFTRKFICARAGSVFVNHIYDGVIENENIPAVYSGILLADDKKTVSQWLY